MSKRRGHMLRGENTYTKTATPGGYVPEFKNAMEFAEKKIAMLEKDFLIKLTDKQKLHLKTLKTEREINTAVRKIIDDAWR